MGGENAYDKLNLYILNENMCFEKQVIPVETENTQVVKTINLNNYHGDFVGFGQIGLLLMVYLVMFYMQELIIKLMILFPLVLLIPLVLFLVLPEPLVLKLIEAQW